MAVSTGRLALLDAAEKLVALKGIHGTSARELTKAAGQRNNSAISYHFGSWHGLLDAVWSRHAPRINIERATLVEVAELDSPPALERLVYAYVHPIAAEVARGNPSYWARFNEQWLAAAPLEFLTVPGPEGVSADYYPSDESLDVLTMLLTRIAERLGLPDSDARRRVGLMVRFVIGSFATWERAQETRSAPDLTAFENEILDLACAMLRVPPR
ncbi:TetR/AcrR family transcriptional regulator [Rhodococcus coprophilus]|uniref:Tetr family transcriptional regulator n=1 Tax=Rhodococcus coprophilus TaxID=38310 RepID=A0A2X4WYV5_9NOCA|nr:TetR/AcrR family transcriptional regulator [Rhodococcus coprophilus]MBM7461377.1 AcrR family transcriptional regulator [Rhodococcus coprophilus]SQI29334.1 tetr family transcriptional regulator [Rhodococcus coprophilus]